MQVEQILLSDKNDWHQQSVSGDPFKDRSLDTVFFAEAGRKALLQRLKHLNRYSDYLLLLVGLAGSGKTLLLNAFEQALPTDTRLLRLKASVLMSSEQLVVEVLSLLNPGVVSSLSLDAQLNQQIANCAADNEQVIVAIENSDELSVEALAKVVSLAGTGNCFKVLLEGEPELEPRVRLSLQNNAHGLYVLRCQPLTNEQLRSYIRFRMQLAGFKDRIPLSEEQIEQINKTAKGCMGAVNELAYAVIQAELEQPSPRILSPTLPTVVLIVALAITTSWWVYQQSFDTQQQHQVEEFITPLETSVIQGRPQQPVPQTPEEISSAMVNPEQISTAPILRQQALSELATAVSAESWEEEAPAPPEVSVAPPVPEALVGLQGPDQLLARANTAYSLQILGSGSAQAVREFIKVSGLAKNQQNDFAYFKSSYKGRPWFVLLYGDYANRRQALQAVAALPGALKQQKPWARSLASIKQDIAPQY